VHLTRYMQQLSPLATERLVKTGSTDCNDLVQPLKANRGQCYALGTIHRRRNRREDVADKPRYTDY